MSARIFGIKNCDTMKKAFIWLEAHDIPYSFHDYKKSGLDADIVKAAIETHGWEQVINRRGTSWRQLPEGVKTSMNATRALEEADKNPSLVKRPLLAYNGQTYLGFKPDIYAAVFL